ncbi:hypothetical protein BU25DRAFT_463329 [Macroventuria anomochaeta]|uniref:Uncharacterized protein n=1 Tax=Macroventuria anomochaeta TaxID=301207 RepID=A0ACB6RLQ3_9PLEO|nr:uncharacterized protein BU25DRAFT_463329 [Macroventuria anomochaeta]KAF2621892.1 hypothetical protein BU25DRAFT_463329 [Macroventuria anomochaeta]
MTATATVTATDSPASLLTSAAIPPLPTNFDSARANGKDATSTVAVVTLLAVIIFSLILLVALSYFIFLHFCSKCPNCPRYEDELKKWKCGDLKPIMPSMVQERMRAWDLERGGMDLQVKMYKDRVQSLVCLEGRADSLWSEDTGDNEKASDYEKEEAKEYFQADAKLQEPAPTHLTAAVEAIALVYKDPDVTLVNPKTCSAHLRDVIAPREAEAKRSLQEAQEQAFAPQCNRASDSTNRESVQHRALGKVNDLIVEREAKKEEADKQRMPAPRQIAQSRFKQHFSVETNKSFD